MASLLFLAYRGTSAGKDNPFSSFGGFKIEAPFLFWSIFAGDPADPERLTPVVPPRWGLFPSGQSPLVVPESAVGPALAVFQRKLILVWSELELEPGLVWWSSFDPATQLWTVPAMIPPPPGVTDPGLRTSRSSVLAVFQDRLFVACRGYLPDGNIHWSSFDGTAWDTTGLYGLSGVNTDVGTANAPTIAAYQGPLDPKPLHIRTAARPGTSAAARPGTSAAGRASGRAAAVGCASDHRRDHRAVRRHHPHHPGAAPRPPMPQAPISGPNPSQPGAPAATASQARHRGHPTAATPPQDRGP